MTELDHLADENRSQTEIARRAIEQEMIAAWGSVDDDVVNVALESTALELARLTDLLRWLAAKWGDNNPLFPDRDPSSGQPLPGNVELSRTWYRVIRGGVRCGSCEGSGHFYWDTDIDGVVHLRLCDSCEGRGYTSEG